MAPLFWRTQKASVQVDFFVTKTLDLRLKDEEEPALQPLSLSDEAAAALAFDLRVKLALSEAQLEMLTGSEPCL